MTQVWGSAGGPSRQAIKKARDREAIDWLARTLSSEFACTVRSQFQHVVACVTYDLKTQGVDMSFRDVTGRRVRRHEWVVGGYLVRLERRLLLSTSDATAIMVSRDGGRSWL